MKTCGQCKLWVKAPNYLNVGTCTAKYPVWVRFGEIASVVIDTTSADLCECFYPKEPEQGKDNE